MIQQEQIEAFSRQIEEIQTEIGKEIIGQKNVIEQLLTVTNESLKSAQLFIGMLPILCVYPFIQKYFTKGLVIGSVKG